MPIPTYDEIIKRYPILTVGAPHEQLVMAAYLAGRADRLEEEIERDTKSLRKKERRNL